MQIERICTFCKQESPPLEMTVNNQKPTQKTRIGRENISDFVLFKKSVYHLDCFMRKVEAERVKKTTAIYKILLAESFADFIERLENETKAHFAPLFLKEELYEFIREQYSINIIPSFIFTKLEAVYSGTYKGMSVGIPPEHLLDMWKRKINELNKLSGHNVTKGKNMAPEKRLSYDLSVLVNKYDSYLKWLNEQKIIAANSAPEANRQSKRIDYSMIERHIKADSQITQKDETDRLLEELF